MVPHAYVPILVTKWHYLPQLHKDGPSVPAQETVALGVKQWAIQAKQNQHFGRGDYNNALHLNLLLLGHPVRHWIPRRYNVSFFT